MNELREYLMVHGFTRDQVMEMRLGDAIQLFEMDVELEAIGDHK